MTDGEVRVTDPQWRAQQAQMLYERLLLAAFGQDWKPGEKINLSAVAEARLLLGQVNAITAPASHGESGASPVVRFLRELVALEEKQGDG